MECKRALADSGGDTEKAREMLRKSGATKAIAKSERSTGAGIVEAYIHPGGRIGVLLKLHCETDFVARNDLFRQLAHDLVLHIAGMSPTHISADDIPEEIKENERRIYGEQFRDSGKPQDIIAKIIEGKMQTYAAEVSLLEQPYVKDQDKKVKDVISEYVAKLGENIRVAGFIRYEI